MHSANAAVENKTQAVRTLTKSIAFILVPLNEQSVLIHWLGQATFWGSLSSVNYVEPARRYNSLTTTVGNIFEPDQVFIQSGATKRLVRSDLSAFQAVFACPITLGHKNQPCTTKSEANSWTGCVVVPRVAN